jgi:hypothetical protein
MKNGIIINGTEYEATTADKPLKRCVKCALRLECFNAGRICSIFSNGMDIYFKVKEQ